MVWELASARRANISATEENIGVEMLSKLKDKQPQEKLIKRKCKCRHFTLKSH
jgi:hypothetical protein